MLSAEHRNRVCQDRRLAPQTCPTNPRCVKWSSPHADVAPCPDANADGCHAGRCVDGWCAHRDGRATRWHSAGLPRSCPRPHRPRSPRATAAGRLGRRVAPGRARQPIAAGRGTPGARPHRPNPRGRRSQKPGLHLLSHRGRRHAPQPECPPRLHRLPRRQRRRPHQAGRSHPSERMRCLARLRESGAVLHAPQPRVARIHPLRQSRRPSRGPHRLRRLPLVDRASGEEEHDDPRLHALERRPLQQRLDPKQAVRLRRELQHARRKPADADRADADRTRDELQGGGRGPRSAAPVRTITAR